MSGDYFEYVIPLLEKDYRLIVPALPGYDFDLANIRILVMRD